MHLCIGHTTLIEVPVMLRLKLQWSLCVWSRAADREGICFLKKGSSWVNLSRPWVRFFRVQSKACASNLSWDLAPGALLWYQLCVCQRSSVIFGFVFMQEWCSGWSLFQSLRVQHSLRCVAGWNNWYSVLSTVPETQQRENRLSPWGKKLSEIKRGKGV